MKAKIFEVSLQFLKCGLDKEFFNQLFYQLPEDAKIIGFDRNINRATTSFLVESGTFEDIEQGKRLPEIQLSLTKLEPNPCAPRNKYWYKVKNKDFNTPTNLKTLSELFKATYGPGVKEELQRHQNKIIDLNNFKIPEEEFIRKFIICECGKDKHGFASHSDYCPKYEKR